jgi:glycosyltransferase domain-containing protein
MPMQDFSLIVPTYDRPRDLARLLAFLDRRQVPWRVLVLDSSHAPEREQNRAMLAHLRLHAEYCEYPVETHPFDKFRDGIDRVETQFCALCADDDVVLPSGSSACVEALRADPEAAVAQGYFFQFIEHPDGRFDLANVLYFAPSILDRTPLARVARQFEQYQATTYGHYRTAVLRNAFHAIKSVESLLARELLTSALSAVAGKVVRVPRFSNGRSMGPSASYDHWHPLEWFAKDADGLFAEYRSYRTVLRAAIAARPDNIHDGCEIGRILDLVHLRYLVKHAPPQAVGFMAESEMAQVPFGTYWPDHKIQIPLIEASGIEIARPALQTRISGWLTAMRPAGLKPTAERIPQVMPGRLGRLQYGVKDSFATFCSSRFASARTVIDTLLSELDDFREPAEAESSA